MDPGPVAGSSLELFDHVAGGIELRRQGLYRAQRPAVAIGQPQGGRRKEARHVAGQGEAAVDKLVHRGVSS
jgi:hypothetical protein